MELKEKKLPTFGTHVERKDRLKKHYSNNYFLIFLELNVNVVSTASPLVDGTNNQNNKKISCLEEIERLK